MRNSFNRSLVAGAVVAMVAAAAPARGQGLSIGTDAGWRGFWRGDAAPARWPGPLLSVTRQVRWRAVRPGVETGEIRVAGSGEAWRVRVVLVRIDPRLHRLALDEARVADGMAGAWTVDSAGAGAVVAFNAGQFSGGTPWGWTVRDGREVRAPGTGPLSMAVVADAAGRIRFVGADSIGAARRAGGVAWAIQSYPALLVNEGQVPSALRPGARDIDLGHRDGRLAIGELRDGRVLVALTRFDGLGGALSTAPLGFTVPEMAGLMGALGCRRAVLLDGGISAQLLVRPARGRALRYPGWRRVPLGILVAPRTAPPAR
jgi:hypothetical protein